MQWFLRTALEAFKNQAKLIWLDEFFQSSASSWRLLDLLILTQHS